METLECPFSKEIWKTLVGGILETDFTSTWSDIMELMTQPSLNPTVAFILRYAFQAAIHAIWGERNGRRHGDDPAPLAVIAKKIDTTVRNRLSTIRSEGVMKQEAGLRIWFATRRAP
ncbi:uncharacterized protein LOC112086729 [Eutrema salsugineum]|uniref:uncharacterized protein LOC112086729 n=1 Tax=Eutrema salsugineum TaxID=72664 RepID=UPI000CED37B9|nr:uncharacterized protein LOC112086729 [Eutrema salsugineum]